MITIDDFGTKLHPFVYEGNDEYTKKYLNLESAYSKKLLRTYPEGGRFLGIGCDDDTFEELLSQSTKVPDSNNLYSFELGEMPQTVRKKLFFDREKELTGRMYNSKTDPKMEWIYCDKKYIDLGDGNISYTKPITWLIDIDARKIISNKVLVYSSETEESLCETLKQQSYIPGKPFNLKNNKIEIENGIAKKFIVFEDKYTIPDGITEIDCNNGMYFKKIRIPKKVNKIKFNGHEDVETLELYDNTIISVYLNVFDKIIINYTSIDNLLKFLDSIKDKIHCGRQYGRTVFVTCILKGPEYIPLKTKRIIKSYDICHNLKCIIESPEDDYEKKEFVELPKEEQKNEEIQVSKENELDEIQELIIKLKTYLPYYKDSEKELKEIAQEIEKYNNSIESIDTAFKAHSLSLETPEQLHTNLLNYLKTKLSDIEYFKMLDFIDECLLSLDTPQESNNELIKDISKISESILKELKSQYKEQFKESIRSILITAKDNIINYINDKKNNSLDNITLEYHNIDELELYLRNKLQPILLEINRAICDEKKKRDIQEEIMKITFGNIKKEYQKAKLSCVSLYLNQLKETLTSLEEKIPNSPFTDDFNNDKQTILEYIKNIDNYINNPNIKREIYSKCITLKKYTDTEESMYPNLDIKIEYTNLETIKLLRTIINIILVLKSLEREVDESIIKNKTIKRCRVKL